MDIKELKLQRDKLAADIARMIEAFEKESGARVADIELSRAMFSSGEYRLQKVNLKLDLD